METWSRRRIYGTLTFSLVAAVSMTLSGCNDDDAVADNSAPGFAVAKASCGANDKPETALQGQVTAAERAAGFKGTNCNLTLVGQYKGEGGNWSTAKFRDRFGKVCAYHATAVPNATRPTPGVPVIDMTNPASPKRAMSLTTGAMLNPWESLRVNYPRQILIADRTSGPNLDIYDLSAGCDNPQLLSTTLPGTGEAGSVPSPRPVMGHEGNISPDGLTYYMGNNPNGMYHAIDISNTTAPKLIATFDTRTLIGVGGHGLSVSKDGNRMYGVTLSNPTPAQVLDPTTPATNGFMVLDTSEVQARKPNAEIKLISKIAFRDGSVAQHTIPIKIAGKPYIVMVDEAGSGGLAEAQTNYITNACSQGMTPFPIARLFDISDEKNPKPGAKFHLETHDCANAEKVRADVMGLTTFTYGSHYCSVDNRENATALACGYFNSGIRVFDIRNPDRPKEIAYYNPPATTGLDGSSHAAQRLIQPGGPDWCASRMDFDMTDKTLTTMCQDSGLLILRFGDGTWPFPESTPSNDQT